MRERLRKLVVLDRFWRAAMVLAGGAAFVQLIGILAAPILTRLYDPAEFGAFAIYLSLLLLVLCICSLRYELAIPLARDDADAAQLLVLSLMIVLGTSALLALVIALVPERFIVWKPMPGMAFYQGVLPLALLGAGIHQVLSHWATRSRDFGLLARSRIAQGVSKTAMQLALGVLGAGAGGLVLGDVLGRLSGGATLVVLRGHGPPPDWGAVCRQGLWRVATRFRRFAALSSGSALFDMATSHLPPLLLSLSFATQTVGWFSLAQQVVFLPIGLIAQAVAQVYIGDAPRAAREGAVPLRRLFLKTSAVLALIALPPAIVLALVAPQLFSLVFGGPWTEAGTFASLMAPVLFFTLVVSPLGYTLNVLERPEILLIWNGARFAAVLAVLLGAPALEGTPVTTVACYSVVVSLMYVTLFVICLWQTRTGPTKGLAERSEASPRWPRDPGD